MPVKCTYTPALENTICCITWTLFIVILEDMCQCFPEEVYLAVLCFEIKGSIICQDRGQAMVSTSIDLYWGDCKYERQCKRQSQDKRLPCGVNIMRD